MFIILAMAIGFFASFISGLFGGGAGLITVPGIYWLLHHYYPNNPYLMQITLATGGSIILPLGLTATWRQFHYNNVDVALLKRSVLIMTLGGLIGVSIIDMLHSNVIKYIFSVFIFIVAIWLWRYKPELNEHWKPPLWLHSLIMGAIGLISIAIGVSVYTVPYFVKLGLNMHKSIGTGAVLVFVNSIVAATILILLGLNVHGLPDWQFGYLNIPIFLAAVVPCIIGSIASVYLLSRLSAEKLKAWFIVLMFVVAIIMLIPR